MVIKPLIRGDTPSEALEWPLVNQCFDKFMSLLVDLVHCRYGKMGGEETSTDFVFRRPVVWEAEMEVADQILLVALFDYGDVFLCLAAQCIKSVFIVVVVYKTQRLIEVQPFIGQAAVEYGALL